MKKAYIIEMTKGGKKSYVEFTYDIVWHESFWKATFYDTPEEADEDIPSLLERENECEKEKLLLAARGLCRLPENYQKPEISMRVREIELNLL